MELWRVGLASAVGIAARHVALDHTSLEHGSDGGQLSGELAVALPVEEAFLLVSVERDVGGVQIQHHFLRLRLVALQAAGNKRSGDGEQRLQNAKPMT